jgi:hypothetical protein
VESVTVKVTTTLDQNAGDESIGYGDMTFEYEFDDGTPSSTNDFDDGVEDPTAEW